MAAALSQDAVLNFLQRSGGSVKNSDLLQHFRNFIRDHANRDRNRELFKKFVNLVATVREEDGVKYVVLRKQFRSEGGSSRPQVPAGEITEPPHPIPAGKLGEAGTPAPAGRTAGKTILPAAGVMTNNNNSVDTNVGVKQLHTAQLSAAPQASGAATERTQLKTPAARGGQPGVGSGPVHGIAPVAPAIRHHGKTSQQVPVPAIPAPQTFKAREVLLKSEGGLHQESPLHNTSVGSQVTPRRVRYRPSYKSAMSCDEEEEEEEDLPVRRSSGGAVWPVNGPLRDTARAISTSSPCIIDHPAPRSVVSSSSDRQPPKIFIQDVDAPGWSSGSGRESPSLPGEPASRRSLPLEAEPYRPSPDPRPLHDVHRDQRCSPPARVPLEPTQALRQNQSVEPSSGQGGGPPSASAAGFSTGHRPLSGSPRGPGWHSSHEDLQARTGATGEAPQILQPSRGAALEPVAHPADSRSLPDAGEAAAPALPPSTGELLDDLEEAGSSDGSTSTPRLRQRPALSRRLSRDVRMRMCRSLGADLDQIVQEEARGAGGGEAARLNRLHRISSSLSLRANLSSSSLSSCSTPPRCRSLVELDEGTEHKGGRRSLPAAHQEAQVGHVKQPLVPLEPREHAWYVKAAVGAWPDIYSLFREDPSLLGKHDFISGFTVLHWIAKHGDHRVLNTLWYGVQKAGLTFSANARSLCGHTPLHIAAIHGSKNVMRLLVKNFGADVKLRDIAGKRPWQYLSGAMSPDIFQLLGAPARAALEGVGLSDQPQQQQQHRRRRHHLSAASSGERPLIVPGVPKVKRSTSLAAFLKHKSLLPFHGQQPGTSM